MIILFVVVAVIISLLLMKTAMKIEYCDSGLTAKAKVGPVWLQVYPGKSDKKKKPEKENKLNELFKKSGNFDTFKAVFPDLLDMFSALRKKLVINKLIIHYTAASVSAYDAAMSFGTVSAAIGMLLPLIENVFILKERDITSSVDFTETVPKIYFNAAVSIRIYQILYIVIKYGFKIMKNVNNIPEKTERKVEQ